MKACRMMSVLMLAPLWLWSVASHASDHNRMTDEQYQQNAKQQSRNLQREIDANKEDRTRSWLAVQRSNTQATSYQDALSPAMAQAAQQRADKSFTHAIPEKFINDSFGE